MERASKTILVALAVLGAVVSVQAQPRKTRVGERLEPFTLPATDGSSFSSDLLRGRATFIAFVEAHQKRSDRALRDLAELTAGQRGEGHPVELLVVINGGAERIDYFRRERDTLGLDATTMVIDADDTLWGRLGVVVTPTALLVDEQSTIRWMRAGHGFDFRTEARTNLRAVVGREPAPGRAPPSAPDASADERVEDRVWRHVRMGQALARRGDLDAGIAEIRRAETLEPASVEVQIELARLLCRAGRAEEALDRAQRIRAETRGDRARVLMVSGWAHRQLGDLDRAIEDLEESVALQPASARAQFERGKVLEARGDCAGALAAYRRALAVHHDEDLSSP